jgi:hypothetical protein
VLLLTARGASAQAVTFGSSPVTEYNPSATYTNINIDGATAVIGQPSPSPGVVYVLTQLEGGTWVQTAQITPPPGDTGVGGFGQGLRVHDGVIAVGAPLTTGPAGANEGAVYVYTLAGSSWTFQQKITDAHGAAGEQFGTGVGLQYVGTPTTMAVSAPFKASPVTGHAQAGAVYAFAYDGTQWVQGQELLGSGASGAEFGLGTTGISDSGDIVVGEQNRGASPVGPGTCYDFVYNGSGWAPRPGSPFQSPAPAQGDYFGNSTSYGNWMIVTAAQSGSGTGVAYVYSMQSGSWVYTGQSLSGNNDLAPSDGFGTGASYRGQDLLIGAPDHTAPGMPTRSGAVYVYSLVGNAFAYRQTLLPPASEAAPNLFFGVRVRLSPTSSTALIEAPGANASGKYGAYFFGPSTPTGTNVMVPGPTGSTASVTFASVTTAGSTNVSADPSCSTLPSGFLVSGSGTTSCLTVSTTATYSGGIDVCIPLPSPAPASPAVVQCDPNPSSGPCPGAGMDPALEQQTTGPQNNPLCCGNVTSYVNTPPGANPICITTHGLSSFAVGASVAAVPVLGGRWVAVLAGALLCCGLLVTAARRRAALH